MLRFKKRTGNQKSRVGTLLFESALIILSVLLGLMANEWRVSKANQQEVEVILRAISQELRGNLARIEQQLPYHRSIDDALELLVNRIYGQQLIVTQTELMKAMPNGFSVPLVEDHAWKLANGTGAIQNIDIALATELAIVYSRQEFYQSKLEMIGQNWYVAGNINPENLAATAIASGMLANDVAIQEQRLIELYKSMIQRLDDLEL